MAIKPVTACSIGCEGTIVKVLAKEPVKGRLISLGVTRGNRLKVLDHTLAKQTWEVECEGTKIALRDEEAASIYIEVPQT